jgi:hypothetical protein
LKEMHTLQRQLKAKMQEKERLWRHMGAEGEQMKAMYGENSKIILLLPWSVVIKMSMNLRLFLVEMSVRVSMRG